MISIICPFYNEQDAAPAFFARLLPVLEPLGEPFEIVCINDGSSDGTLEALLSAQRGCSAIRILDLSRNFGKEAALSAGLEHARGDAVIPIDADLQDPPELIPQLVARWREGYEVVLARRAQRGFDGWLKRCSAAWFYRVHNYISDVRIPDNVGDFRLLDRAVVDAIRRLPERRRFMKGVFAWVGFRSTSVEYARAPRAAGRSKFSGWKLWNFALEGVTSFSMAPLRIWTYLGLAVALLAFIYGLFIILRTLIVGVDVPGYASLLTAVLFLGGVQLIGLGVLGEYIGRTYSESKQRPLYIVRRAYDGGDPPA